MGAHAHRFGKRSLRRLVLAAHPRHALAGLAALLVLTQLLGLIWPGLPLGRQRAAQAVAPGAGAFQRTWARTDQPIAAGAVARTWMWGPEAISAVLTEPYADAPGGARQVQYFDKSRMEVTQPDGDPASVWYVTNGLLVLEMINGRVQVGDAQFAAHAPAEVNVAGDPDDPDGPTYATFASLQDDPTQPDGVTITQRLTRDGRVHADPALAAHGVTAAFRVQVHGLEHQVASVFWEFMHSSGVIWDGSALVQDALFLNPFYATGYPVAEAYWASVRIGGTPADVLVQCFERRCLTWTPGNPPEWQVEAGNVGQHYRAWRATHTPPPSTATAPPATATSANGTASASASATPGGTTASGTATSTPRATRTPTTTGEPRPTRTPAPTATTVVATVTATATRTVTQVVQPNANEARTLDSEERAMLVLINAYRDEYDLPPLVVAEALNCAAYGYSYDMAERNYLGFGPDRDQTMPPFPAWLDGPGIAERAAFRGYTNASVLAENIAGGNATFQYASAVFAAWEDTPGFAAKMRNADVDHIGIGRVHRPLSSTYTWYWTTDFGARSAGPAACR